MTLTDKQTSKNTKPPHTVELDTEGNARSSVWGAGGGRPGGHGNLRDPTVSAHSVVYSCTVLLVLYDLVTMLPGSTSTPRE